MTTKFSISRRDQIRDLPMISWQMSRHILAAAKDGQILPVCTVMLVVHSVIHFMLTSGVEIKAIALLPNVLIAKRTEPFRLLSTSILVLNLVLNIYGYVVLTMLWRHSVTTIFNRQIPSTWLECVPCFAAHMKMLRPVEATYRYLTARFRVLPDVLVLGETRCGTTTFCAEIVTSLPGCHTPFCLWKHPELDNKETFYFVGHYLGLASPATYRMCFPLSITKWFHVKILRRPFFTFDGCAQYLNSPTAPYLLAEAYRQAGLKPPVLVACVRDPVDQAISWWRYENNAMLWGEGMGLSEWNEDLRSGAYPPQSITHALNFSYSDNVQALYAAAEEQASSVINSTQTREKQFFLPPTSMTWPGGQLTGIGRNGSYASNIGRYERVFHDAFVKSNYHARRNLSNCSARVVNNEQSSLQFVNIFSLEYLSCTDKLSAVLKSVMKQVFSRDDDLSHVREKFLDTAIPSKKTQRKTHRNAGTLLADKKLEPTAADRHTLSCFFAEETRRLQSDCGIDFGWKSSVIKDY